MIYMIRGSVQRLNGQKTDGWQCHWPFLLVCAFLAALALVRAAPETPLLIKAEMR